MSKVAVYESLPIIDLDPLDRITTLNLIPRRLLDEVGICPTYNQIKNWSYDCEFKTVRIGNRAGVAERDWPAARDAIAALVAR